MGTETVIRARRALLPGGWADDVEIRVLGGRIAEVRRGAAGPGVHACVLPGLANVHDRAEVRILRILAGGAGEAAAKRLLRLWQSVGPEELEALIAGEFVAAMEAGWAAVGLVQSIHHGPGGAAHAEPSEMAGRVCAAAGAAGIGLTLLPEFRTWGGARQAPLPPGAERTGATPEGFLRIMEGAARAVRALGEDARLGLAPLRLSATTADELSIVLDACPEGPVHMQVARSPRDAVEVLAAFGARPVTWLLNLLGLDERWCLVHANGMTPAETAALAASGATLGLCPLALPPEPEGRPDAAAFLRAGGAVGIGTDDGPLAPPDRVASALGLARSDAAEGAALYGRLARGSARAIGRASGEIAPGRLADLVALDRVGPGARVRHLWSAGRHMVAEGRHVARVPILARAREAAARLRAVL